MRRPEQVQHPTHKVGHAVDAGQAELTVCGDGPFELLDDVTFETWQPPRPVDRRCRDCDQLVRAAVESRGGDAPAL